MSSLPTQVAGVIAAASAGVTAGIGASSAPAVGVPALVAAVVFGAIWYRGERPTQTPTVDVVDTEIPDALLADLIDIWTRRSPK